MCGGGSGARAALGKGEREGLYVLLLRKEKGKCFYYLRGDKVSVRLGRKRRIVKRSPAHTHKAFVCASQARGAGQEGRKE